MNPTTVMMTLGEYQFSLATAAFQNFSRRMGWRWASQERLNREPALQYVGPGEEGIDLDGAIYPEYWGGLGQLDAMRAEADKGVPLQLISGWNGEGQVHGQYVIESIEETQTTFWANGQPRKVDFRLSLKKYGGDEA